MTSVEDFVLQDGQCGTFSQQIITEGAASAFDLSASFLLKAASKAEISELTLIPEAAAHFSPVIIALKCGVWL